MLGEVFANIQLQRLQHVRLAGLNREVIVKNSNVGRINAGRPLTRAIPSHASLAHVRATLKIQAPAGPVILQTVAQVDFGA